MAFGNTDTIYTGYFRRSALLSRDTSHDVSFKNLNHDDYQLI